MKFSKFFVPFIFCQAMHAAGFTPQTCILTASGPVPVCDLSGDAFVIGFKENAYLCCTRVAYRKTSTVSQLVMITVGEQPDF